MNHQTILIALLGAMPCIAIASPALIYEGTLTTGGQAPDPWPALRFSILSADDDVVWSSEIHRAGPIDLDASGRFAAYLKDSINNPFPVDGIAQASALKVEVCVAAENQGECDWLLLDESQRLGAVPLALVAQLPTPLRERHRVADPAPPGDEDNLWPYSEAIAQAPATGLYLISASYSCRSDCDGDGRYPHEYLYINDIETVERLRHKMCNRGEPFEEKTFLPVIRHLDAGDQVRFRAATWSCNQYRYANISLSPLSTAAAPPVDE